MAHESFEDLETARMMNALFVNVKLDREERPDVDAVYMEATQALTGQGGWPMTCFLTPEAEPFFCGTYYPKAHFLELSRRVSEAWTEQRGDLVKQGQQLVAALSDTAPPVAGGVVTADDLS